MIFNVFPICALIYVCLGGCVDVWACLHEKTRMYIILWCLSSLCWPCLLLMNHPTPCQYGVHYLHRVFTWPAHAWTPLKNMENAIDCSKCWAWRDLWPSFPKSSSAEPTSKMVILSTRVVILSLLFWFLFYFYFYIYLLYLIIFFHFFKDSL